MNLTELIMFLIQALNNADPTVLAAASPIAQNQLLIATSKGDKFRVTVEVL
jgi:hypothetical protein